VPATRHLRTACRDWAAAIQQATEEPGRFHPTSHKVGAAARAPYGGSARGGQHWAKACWSGASYLCQCSACFARSKADAGALFQNEMPSAVRAHRRTD